MKDTVKPVMEMNEKEYEEYVRVEIKKQIDERKMNAPKSKVFD